MSKSVILAIGPPQSKFANLVLPSHGYVTFGIDYGRESQTIITKSQNENFKAKGSVDYISPDGNELPVIDGNFAEKLVEMSFKRRTF